MFFSYADCITKYGNAYQLNKALEDGLVFKLEDGIYSDSEYESEVAIISKKYPDGIFTGEFVFYVHGLTDLIPEKYALATKAKATPLVDGRIEQIYTRDDLLNIGVIQMEVDGAAIPIYDKERMIIELLRNKNKMPKDLYKEIIGNYRRIIESLEIWRIQEYLDIFPKSKMIKKAFDEEIL